MNGFSRFNLLVLALITFASFCTARTVVTITGKCTTRYCGYSFPRSKVHKTIKTICTTGRYTVTRWKTVTKPKATKTITKTKKVTVPVTKTISTVTSVTTISGSVTSVYASTITISTTVATFDITTKTIQSTVTVPAPPGFVGVNDDPDNRLAGQVEIRRREAEPEPEPAAQKKWVNAIVCTNTILTKTGTSDLWKTTTKTTGTITKTVSTAQTVRQTTTVTKKNPVIVRSTVTKLVTISQFTTVTTTSWITSYLTTVTTRPTATSTYYAACGPRNLGPPPDEERYYAYNASPDFDEKLEIVWSNGSIYDCCVSCMTYKGPGTCMGSVYNYQGHWGAPDCPELDWDVCPPRIPKWYSKCELAISGGSGGTCRAHRYEYLWYFNQPPTVVSNGPSCKRFKYRKALQPL
ncbi:hypothetical protein TWF718_008688 [Orbilia javanica]|uniref:Uncharacterized protein n=1 Tax=Orbilia javanica TaxID=47235 RepID=A0AAN8N0V7_9PEZI